MAGQGPTPQSDAKRKHTSFTSTTYQHNFAGITSQHSSVKAATSNSMPNILNKKKCRIRIQSTKSHHYVISSIIPSHRQKKSVSHQYLHQKSSKKENKNLENALPYQ